MEKDEIISNDENLIITSFTNAKRICTNNWNIKRYRSIKDCIYDIFGSPIYNAIDNRYMQRILHEYFKNKEKEDIKFLVDKLDDSFDNFNEFCCIIQKLQLYEENIDLHKAFEFYTTSKSKSFLRFKKVFTDNKFTVFTSIDVIEKLEDFSYTNYFFLLRHFSEELGLHNIEDKVKEFYFFLQDLYYEEKIFYRMEYKDVKPLVINLKCFLVLSQSTYQPENIYYCFLDNLEEQYKEKMTELDKRSVVRYQKYLKESKEEGEL